QWGMLSPAHFIPLAEETGFITEINQWIIKQVCTQLRKWIDEGYTLVPISINLSAKTLMQADLFHKIRDTLAEYNICSRYIEIEITEESLIHNQGSALQTIQRLRDLGISIAIDDFG